MRFFLVSLALAATACGRITPGSVFRPGKTTYGSSGSSSGRSSKSDSSKPVFDDKGCANMSGEGGAKIQAACRAK